jgi:hypothetical protein
MDIVPPVDLIGFIKREAFQDFRNPFEIGGLVEEEFGAGGGGR